MSLHFHCHDVQLKLAGKNKIKAWVKQSVEDEGNLLGVVNLIFCTDAYLLEINEEYLNHDFYTDIITFQYTDRPISGDLFMSLDRINENAAKYRVHVRQEILRVIIHGILHLCGYSDKSANSKLLMSKKEDFYLAKWQEF